jgi:hypothetical protein
MKRTMTTLADHHLRRSLLFMLLLLAAGILFFGQWVLTRAAAVTCSVPSASYATINAALADSACTTIELANGTYTETLTLGRDVTIEGGHNSLAKIQAAADRNLADSRVITVTASATVVLRGLTVRHGDQTGTCCGQDVGGGILNQGDLTLDGVIVELNDAPHGGGIFNSGTLLLSDSNVRFNHATADGGGINNNSFGTLISIDSSIVFNESEQQGGGIYTYGVVELYNNLLIGNEGVIAGGVFIGGGNPVTVVGGAVYQNSANSSNGGGFANYGTTALLTLKGVEIFDNYALNDGGGVWTWSRTRIEDSIIRNNDSDSDGGGVFHYDGHLEIARTAILSNTTEGNGGGTHSVLATAYMTMTESTVGFNSTGVFGGGIYGNSANITLRNVTVTGNSASAESGGIGIFMGSIDMAHVSITNNSTSGSGDIAGGIGIFSPVAVARNVIIIGNTAPNSDTKDCWADSTTFSGFGYNLVGTGTCTSHFIGGSISSSADPAAMINANAHLNGHAFLLTHSLPSGSWAKATPWASCMTNDGSFLLTDQRGTPRPSGSSCDVGAYQTGSGFFLPIVVRP